MPDPKDFYDDYAFPLHSALDFANDMDGASIKQRWAVVMERCPWLAEMCQPPPAPVDVEQEPYDWKRAPWVAVESTNIESYTTTRTSDEAFDLYVRFKGGAVYRYESVKSLDVTEFVDADSKGSFLNNRIKGVYKAEKLSE